MDISWDSVLEQISTKISRASFETWLKHTSAEIIDNTIVVQASNSFASDWIERHYRELISTVLTEISGKTYELIIVDNNNRASDAESTPLKASTTDNNFDKLIKLVKEQNELIKAQQERINALEKRVDDIEVKIKEIN